MLFTIGTAQIALQSRFGAVMFLTGKLLRFALFLLFLMLLLGRVKTIGIFTFWEVMFFFATWQFIDEVVQFFMREVYRFRAKILNGYFDYTLLRPLNSLFHPLFGGADVLDIPILLLSILFIFFAATHIDGITLIGVLLYVVLVINAFLIALSFHIATLAIGILTTEVENTIFLYRDITQMGRFPIDLYREPVRSILMFVIPVGIMMTFPAKALLGLLNPAFIFIALGVGFLLLSLSYTFWIYALRYYSSASS